MLVSNQYWTAKFFSTFSTDFIAISNDKKWKLIKGTSNVYIYTFTYRIIAKSIHISVYFW